MLAGAALAISMQEPVLAALKELVLPELHALLETKDSENGKQGFRLGKDKENGTIC